MRTAFTDLVGCTDPVQQAPMGPIASPALAREVARAGGVGMLTALRLPPAVLSKMLDQLAGAGTFGVNFLVPEIDQACLALAAERARVVDFFWGRPDPELVALGHVGGALVSWQVGSLEEARAAVDSGCDFLAVQGTEAGGHVWGRAALLPLLCQVLDAVDVPVLAAGGVSTPRALAAVLAAGAAGARVGTRFVASTESGAHEVYKQAVVAAGEGETVLTDRYAVECPLCAVRARTRVLTACLAAADAADEDPVGEMDLGRQTYPVPRYAGIPAHAGTRGNVAAMCCYAGEGAVGIDAVAPAGQILRRLVDGADELLGRAAQGAQETITTV